MRKVEVRLYAFIVVYFLFLVVSGQKLVELLQIIFINDRVPDDVAKFYE